MARRRLIAAYDGSESAEDGLALAVVLAGSLAATPLIAMVLTQHDHLLGSARLESVAEEGTRGVLDRGAGRFAPIEAETSALVDRSPARALNELAEAVDPVAIVLGPARHGAAGRVLLGSVGRALLSGAPSAVAVAPHGYSETEARSLQQIGVAVNGSPESRSALRAAAGLAARLHARLTLLTAIEPMRLSDGGQYPVLDPNAYRSASERAMRAALDEAGEAVPQGVATQRRLLRGDPVSELAAAALELDLLVLGSRGYGPVRRALLGSVSSKLIERAPCPVLVLPRSAGDEPLGLAAAEGTP